MAQVTPGDYATPTGAQAASAHLRELLLRPGKYRRKREQYAERSRLGLLNQLEAVVDGVDRVPYRADTNALTIEVGQGFSGLAGPFYQPVAELFVVDMLLAKPLAAGETATLEYSAGFHYAMPPAPEFRRVVQYFVEDLDIRVEFHPDRLPGHVVWAVWDGMDGPIVEREPVVLDSQFAVHRYLRLAEKTVAGFHWDW